MNRLSTSDLGEVLSPLIYGCMSLGEKAEHRSLTKSDVADARAAIEAALSIGITTFDHADVYALGKAEAVFGRFCRDPGLRERITIQSKCGVRLDEGGVAVQYDLSKAWVLRAVDDSLSRLGTDYLDLLLLHRPDPLMRCEEIADAFASLTAAGKVKSFGVSNMSAVQMRELQRHLDVPLVACQLEMSLGRRDWIERDLAINDPGPQSSFPDGTLQYCHEHGVELQAWAPLARGIYSGAPSDPPDDARRQTAALVAELAQPRNEQRSDRLGWLLKHPANIRPVIGPLIPTGSACADSVRQAELMTRSDWYALLTNARGLMRLELVTFNWVIGAFGGSQHHAAASRAGVWDLWMARTGSDYHMFYLQAPKNLEDPELRHRSASVGHAVSPDLVSWTVVPDAIGRVHRGLGTTRQRGRIRHRARRGVAHVLHRNIITRRRSRPTRRPRHFLRPRRMDEGRSKPGNRRRSTMVRGARPRRMARARLARSVGLPGPDGQGSHALITAVPRVAQSMSGESSATRPRQSQLVDGSAASSRANSGTSRSPRSRWSTASRYSYSQSVPQTSASVDVGNVRR